MRLAFAIRNGGIFMSKDLQQLNGQNKLAIWAKRISECRSSGQNVKVWCKENGVCEQTYYRWQKKLFAMAQVQQEMQFAEITPVMAASGSQIAVSVHMGDITANIHNGADLITVENVLHILKLC